jgi:putative FmdB family regulatory protein
MPTYDYECQKCGKEFSETTTISEHDKEKPRCPECSSTEVRQFVEEFFAVTSKKS